eukprot:3693115-Amphidinium_carterae.1
MFLANPGAPSMLPSPAEDNSDCKSAFAMVHIIGLGESATKASLDLAPQATLDLSLTSNSPLS